jgi:hypothetical protein
MELMNAPLNWKFKTTGGIRRGNRPGQTSERNWKVFSKTVAAGFEPALCAT